MDTAAKVRSMSWGVATLATLVSLAAAAAAALAANGRQIGVVVSGQGKGWLALAGGSQGVHRVVALFVAIAEASNKLRPTVVEVYWVSMV